ncbi:MAG: hypothetical protein ACKV2V_05535 [Blastocatellia bacterium]
MNGPMTDTQRRSHAMSQLRASRELYSDTGERAYLSVIDVHLRAIAEVDERRRLSDARRAALQELRRQAELSDLMENMAVKNPETPQPGPVAG